MYDPKRYETELAALLNLLKQHKLKVMPIPAWEASQGEPLNPWCAMPMPQLKSQFGWNRLEK